MSDFWNGAISSLLGAAVGGFATASVAWFQLRANYRQQVQLVHLQGSLTARLGLAEAFDAASAKFYEMSSRHRDGAKCPVRRYRDVERIQRIINRAFAIHHNALDEQHVEMLINALDYANRNAKGIAELAAKYTEEEPDSCGYCTYADSASDALYDVALLLAPGNRLSR